MNSTHVKKPEQIQLIMECRRSGLSDYQWCREHGIHPGTFYNWVSKLKKAGYTISDSESRTLTAPAHQEVVKLDVLENTTSTPCHDRAKRLLSTHAACTMYRGRNRMRGNPDPPLQRCG